MLALRNPVLVRLGVRNFGRRRGRTALIVLGLMLGTTIIAAALVTGDTMSHTIRRPRPPRSARRTRSSRRRAPWTTSPATSATRAGAGYFPESVAGEIDASHARPELAGRRRAGRSSRTWPCRLPRDAARASRSAMLFARRPRADGRASPQIRRPTGGASRSRIFGPGEVYLNVDGGRRARRAAGRHGARLRRRAIRPT